MKKLVSLLLLMVFVLSLTTFTASADEPKQLIWWTTAGGDAPIDAQMVVDAANKISAE